jgi:hypothetical protein
LTYEDTGADVKVGPELDRRHEDRDLRHGFRDAVVGGHGHRLAKRDHPALEELVVVGGDRGASRVEGILVDASDASEWRARPRRPRAS